jgi:hypothetical protein
MNPALRKRHLWSWIILAIIISLLFVLSLAANPQFSQGVFLIISPEFQIIHLAI